MTDTTSCLFKRAGYLLAIALTAKYTQNATHRYPKNNFFDFHGIKLIFKAKMALDCNLT